MSKGENDKSGILFCNIQFSLEDDTVSHVLSVYLTMTPRLQLSKVTFEVENDLGGLRTPGRKL